MMETEDGEKQTGDGGETHKSQDLRNRDLLLARERTAYDEAVKHFGVDVAALHHYFPKGRP